MIPSTVTPEALNKWSRNTLIETLNITFTEVGNDYLIATMPVDHRVHQPMGLLHGGASIALAETVGSTGSAMMVDLEKYAVVGLNIQTNHLKSLKSGYVKATGKIVHKGMSTHIWDITITGPEGQIISLCRLTNFIKELRHAAAK